MPQHWVVLPAYAKLTAADAACLAWDDMHIGEGLHIIQYARRASLSLYLERPRRPAGCQLIILFVVWSGNNNSEFRQEQHSVGEKNCLTSFSIQ